MTVRDLIRHLERLARKGSELHDVEGPNGTLIYEDEIEVDSENGVVKFNVGD